MTAAEIVTELEGLGSDSYKRILFNHGVREPVFGVKVEELKKFQKRIKKDYQLALDLFETGIYDAQYLAGLIADDARMTEADLRNWLATGNCVGLCGTTVAWVAAGSEHGRKLALEWIEAPEANTAQTGWMTLNSLVSVTGDAHLNLAELQGLLERVEHTIHQQPDRVRYAMNSYVIVLGSYVPELTEAAIAAGERIGKVTVDMGATACVVPSSPAYIRKVQARGAIGKKRKSAKC
ncbi:MAG: DNA alkylation repair protein [Actinomycetota bacterium]